MKLLWSDCVTAHEHHQAGPADDAVPIDPILYLHMGLQLTVWLALFPLTMVLGLVRHRLHVPLSVLSLALTTGGYILGHAHGGRSFPHTAHGSLATLVIFYLGAQGVLGLYLKAHFDLGKYERSWIRPAAVIVHGLLGRSFPIVGWVQCVLGLITLRSWCFGGRLGQCLAHHIMGSAFIAYCVLLLIALKAGAGWLKRRNQSQEYFDSWVILLWGIVNTFTEHHGGPWTHKDLQHTLMGVACWAGGAVGVFLSRGGRRTIWPGIIIILTGWAMSGHAQELMLSTMVHSLFGYALMAAGATRIIEVCFVIDGKPTGEVPSPRSSSISTSSPHDATDTRHGSSTWYPIKPFQYLPPYLLVASGVLFMSGTDEELHWANDQGVDHITWGLIDFSISFIIFLWSNILIELYMRWGGRYGMRAGGTSAPAGDEAGAGARLGGMELEGYEQLELRDSIDGGPQMPMAALASSAPTHAAGEEAEVRTSRPSQPQPRQGSKNASARITPSLPNRKASSPANGNAHGHEKQHVLFDEDEENKDPFDDEDEDRINQRER
ncbi:hypothetical protein K437DRAFT_224894 [Tilletiaria anomala UBC 951]|uniref:Protein YTP1-like C-terminal domain-containing protein n=1 Tax=Tilletiaria anomala (strain ATCC 24038 / CBS 436.72 / UBC 951) TaxID=1037660 RepID=A0A066W0D6_TILAU|nr:uncharacterized protein K437DRAFT_224894 [Tilletiaria anomala UBC 951]KDN44529.1 hypothetical protein K437DRAFT_224894 [Tilletiaria anomala UBC 951]